MIYDIGANASIGDDVKMLNWLVRIVIASTQLSMWCKITIMLWVWSFIRPTLCGSKSAGTLLYLNVYLCFLFLCFVYSLLFCFFFMFGRFGSPMTVCIHESLFFVLLFFSLLCKCGVWDRFILCNRGHLQLIHVYGRFDDSKEYYRIAHKH